MNPVVTATEQVGQVVKLDNFVRRCKCLSASNVILVCVTAALVVKVLLVRTSWVPRTAAAQAI